MLINLRNALMAGKRLPYDAEVEYLQSSGTQYIDTLVNADSNLSVEITMANAGTPWTNFNPGGAILATPRYRHHLNFNNNTNYNGINYYLGAGDMCLAASGYRPADGEIFTFKVDAISKTFALGSFLGTFPNDTFDTGLSYWLFGRNGTTPPQLGSLYIYSAKLWNGSTLVRDYIPVRKGTVGYLYDRVSGKLFGNAGTGDFVLGPDVVPVEYIESHGTEYIDTGYVPNMNSVFDVTFSPNNVDFVSHPVHGNAYAGTGRYASSSRNPTTLWTGNDFNNRFFSAPVAMNGLVVGQKYHVVQSAASLSRDGVVIGNYDSSQMRTPLDEPMWLFAFMDSATTRVYGLLRMNSWNASELGVSMRKMLPVRVGTEGAMMDVLTRRIYRNAGTGAFTYGNDLKYPIPAE